MAKRIEKSEFNSLISALQDQGYNVVGPRAQEGTIHYDLIEKVEDLPVGYRDTQEAAKYRLEKTDSPELFGFNHGVDSWKKFLFPAKTKLWDAKKTDKGFEITEVPAQDKPYAFLGVRACELHAIEIQDKVFIDSLEPNAGYKERRESALIIAVNCAKAASTCFCSSMDTGPDVKSGYDILLNEIIDGDEHYFIAETGSDRGEDIIAKVKSGDASEDNLNKVDEMIANTKEQITKTLNTEGIKELFTRSYDHKHWDEVAERCLSCANCTLVCPTCFCSNVEDKKDLTGEHAERWQSWDSCFTKDFSYIHGGDVRKHLKSRYRHWITHKLSAWHDQFGSSGCVGCGRCISWCPVGIDITEEAKKLREDS